MLYVMFSNCRCILVLISGSLQQTLDVGCNFSIEIDVMLNPIQ